ncbi:hypothetical protein [Glycomyces albidus]|uniref:Uncharacterized protein n=1 Tax=Glycomyces albidus TaxID=2656774 RepID=A0A6L5GCM0_9ACTN|nr:hypothetical protein [Glycomyces albidus]MQM27437.1 hypothetical protein [Glycomyces albidus]
MNGYSFQLVNGVRPEEVASATSTVFGVPASSIEVLEWRQGKAHVVGSRVEGMPAVLIQRDPDRHGDYVAFDAGEEFASAVGGLPEVTVASRLCAALRARAVLAAPNAASAALWILVAEDGSSGEVLVDVDDLDDGVFAITGGLTEIKGAPEIPVIELPEGFNPYRT